MNWNVKFKERQGVVVRVVEAETREQAEEVSRAYADERCADSFCRFVMVDGPMVVAGPEILKRRRVSESDDERPSAQERLRQRVGAGA